MTQTLTTEQLKERIGHLKERLRDMKQHKYPDDCPNATAYLESLKAERQQDIELLEEHLANREAQPVGYIAEVSGNRVGVLRGLPMPDVGSLIYTAPPAPTPAPAVQSVVDWRLDESTGAKILMYKDCSVIEDQQAEYVLSLIRSATAAPDTVDIFADQVIGTKTKIIHMPAPLNVPQEGIRVYLNADELFMQLENQGYIVEVSNE